MKKIKWAGLLVCLSTLSSILVKTVLNTFVHLRDLSEISRGERRWSFSVKR